MPALQSHTPLEYQLQRLAVCPGASPSTFLCPGVLHLSVGNNDPFFAGSLRGSPQPTAWHTARLSSLVDPPSPTFTL